MPIPITMREFTSNVSQKRRGKMCTHREKFPYLIQFSFNIRGHREVSRAGIVVLNVQKCTFHVVLCFNHKVRSLHLTPDGLAHLSSHLFVFAIFLSLFSFKAHHLRRLTNTHFLASRLINKKKQRMNEMNIFICRRAWTFIGAWIH